MSKLQFESLRHEISHLVHGSREPLSAKQLLPMCGMAEDGKQLANALYNMCAAKQLTQHHAPEGSGDGVRWRYGPGKVKLGATQPKNDPPKELAAQGAGGARPARSLRKKAVMHKVHKPKVAKLRTDHESRITGNEPRWALTSDGAFLLLDRGQAPSHEIPAPAARALVEFVRRLDQAEV